MSESLFSDFNLVVPTTSPYVNFRHESSAAFVCNNSRARHPNLMHGIRSVCMTVKRRIIVLALAKRLLVVVIPVM